MPNAPDEFTDVELAFPTGGIDRLYGFDRQLPGTTPTGQNVRAFEQLAFRGRGGSRCGLSRYLADALPGPVQCLALVVTTDPTATLDHFDADSFSFPPYPVIPIGGAWGPGFPLGHSPIDSPVFLGQPVDAVDDPSSPGVGNPLDGSGGNFGRNPLRATGHPRRVRNHGSARQQARQPSVLIPIEIKARNNGKALGDTFVFTGDPSEWFASGDFVTGDITNVVLTSDGTPPAAPAGKYDIIAANASGPNAGKYAITYVVDTLGFNVVAS